MSDNEAQFPVSGKHWVTEIDAVKEPEIGSSYPTNLPARTCMDVFKATVERNGDGLALTGADGTELTWKQYYNQCHAFAKSLIKVGFEMHNCVSIIGFNSIEWFVSDIGAIAAGGVAAGIYTTNGPEACQYVADHSRSVVVVCEGVEQLEKFIEVQDGLPHCKALVVWADGGKVTDEMRETCSKELYTWEQFLAHGKDVADDQVAERQAATKPGHCATLIYTSGTTGPPKGVMISHDNIVWTGAVASKAVDLGPDDVEVSYLPLSHIAAQMLDIHMPMMHGSRIAFARPDALKGSLVATLQAVRPTIFFGVPRVWEKIQERMLAVGATVTGVKRSIADWAKRKGLENAQNKQYGGTGAAPGCFGCAHKIVLSKIHERLGLDRCKGFFVAAAPISADTLNYFGSIGIHIWEIFGQSECTGPTTLNTGDAWRVGTVGRPLDGAEIKLTEQDQEIIYRGRHIFMGYLYMPEKTAETIDDDGFLHSGDVGSFDEDGFLRITGRIKEILITAGGENVPPVLIEQQIKKALPAVSFAIVIGDKQKFLTALITIKSEVDIETQEPKDELAPEALRVSKEIGSSATTVTEALNDDKWKAYIDGGLRVANEAATSKAQRVSKFTILSKDLSLPAGDLTATLKLKRSVVLKRNLEVVKELYGEAWRE